MKNNNGSFVPVLSNWSFDLTGGDAALDAFSCAPRTPRQKAAQRNAAKKNTACAADTCPAAVTPETPCQANTRPSNGYQPQPACAENACTGQADCNCEVCIQQRAACAAPIAPTAAPGATCPLYPQNYPVNEAVGMVYAAWQTLADTFDAQSALLVGTLFPELHKPMNGYGPNGENCATHQQEAAFVAWELRLFLDTHPHDARALAMMQRAMMEAQGTYATAFMGECTAAWNWTNAPWPWELDANCC